MKRRVLLLLTMLMVGLFATPVFAATKDQAKIEKQVKTWVKYAKIPSGKKLAKLYVPLKERKKYSVRGFDSESYFKGFRKTIKRMHKDYLKYEIKSVKVSGKKATAKVKFQYFDGTQVVDNAFLNMLLSYEDSWSAEKMMKTMGNYTYIEYIALTNRENNVKTKTVKIPFVKRKGKWLITKQTKAMQKVFDCGFSQECDVLFSN